MELSIELAKRIEESADDHDFELYKDYSGRFMYGDKCWGIVSSQPMRDLVTLAIDLAAEDISLAYDFEDAIRECAMDNYGMDTIVYFPRSQWPTDMDEEDEDEDFEEDEELEEMEARADEARASENA